MRSRGVLEVVVRRGEGEIVVILVGELDDDNCAALRSAIEPLITTTDHLRLDLGGVSFMDSSGLTLLLQLRPLVAELEVSNTRRSVYRVLELTGIVEYLRVT